ncbi:MAG TPA: hypothetical protein VGM92_08330 [Candidatus Kapabacteria bacterium]|jgi:hypothetical protein
MNTLHRILPIFFALALFAACKSSTQIIENEVGIIRGSVQPYENCQPLPNRSGATVSIQGTSLSTTSDTVGNWMISNVPAGIYNILITKPGFDTDLITQDQFSGAGTQFQEGQQIHLETLLPDSVLITSIQVTKMDSIRYRGDSVVNIRDSLGRLTGDSINYYLYDTIGYEYPLTVTFTMQGPDSAIYFTRTLADMTHDTTLSLYYYNPYFYNGATIARNNSITLSTTMFTLLDDKGGFEGYPHPGDTIVISTIPTPSCQGRKVIVLSKSFVLP